MEEDQPLESNDAEGRSRVCLYLDYPTLLQESRSSIRTQDDYSVQILSMTILWQILLAKGHIILWFVLVYNILKFMLFDK